MLDFSAAMFTKSLQNHKKWLKDPVIENRKIPHHHKLIIQLVSAELSYPVIKNFQLSIQNASQLLKRTKNQIKKKYKTK